MGANTKEFLEMPAALQLDPRPAPTNTELSRRVASGDKRAFELLMRRHNQSLFRTARAILRDDAEAEEAVQDGYLRAYRSISMFRGEARLSTWLTRIVVNEALARRRKAVRRAEIVPIHGAGDFEPETFMSSDEEPHKRAERREMRQLIEAEIDALPDAFRTVFVLRALEELSVEETAAALDIPPATVRSRFLRARGRLREALSREIDLAIDGAFAFAGERCDRIVARVLAAIAAETLLQPSTKE